MRVLGGGYWEEEGAVTGWSKSNVQQQQRPQIGPALEVESSNPLVPTLC